MEYFFDIVFAVLCGVIAHRKNRNVILWVLLGLFFNILSLIVVFFLRPKYSGSSNSTQTNETSHNQSGNVVICPHCSGEVLIDGFGSWTCPHCNEVFEYKSYAKAEPREEQREEQRKEQREEPLPDGVTLLIKLFAKISKADGVVSQREINLVDNIIKRDFQPNNIQLNQVRQTFNESKKTHQGYEEIVLDLYDILHQEPRVLMAIIEYLKEIARVDGHIHPEQEMIILYSVRKFNLNREYENSRSEYENEIDEYYKILGCSQDDSIATIKRTYHKLILKYHPDKYMNQNLSQEKIEEINNRFKAIKNAYEKIQESKKSA